ncbi:MAG: hypothetical protein J6W74_00110 [Bacteroidales bacterium]|nr:hypothetical protein [Bacteroidales bacterium]MBP5689297.1 hypothetical protein [Bacteroidales bacterium]
MSYSNGLVLKEVSSYPITGDIQQALGGIDEGDDGKLCTHQNINKFAKYKPNNIQQDEEPTDAQLLTIRYALAARATNNRASLATMALDWVYSGAQAPYFRKLDFHRYYNGAPIPFMQANGQNLIVDLIAGNANPALFYMLMNDGAMANKPFVDGAGIGTSGTAVPANRLQYCIAVEDLGFDLGSSTYLSIMGAVLGLVIFQGTTYKGEVWASQPVAHLSQRENNMYNVPTGSLSLAPGTYTAVACAKLTDGNFTYYLPVFNDANYPTRFSFVVGGMDYYKQDRVGIALVGSSSFVSNLTTNANNLQVKMRLYNQTGRAVTLYNVTNGRFILSTKITGTVVDARGTHTVDLPAQISQLATPTTDPAIADGSYVEMTFQISNIWNYTAGVQPSLIESGSLNIAPSLQFFSGGTATDFGLYGFARVISVTYGS